jgi:lipid A ethanolaminephosphotransferase
MLVQHRVPITVTALLAAALAVLIDLIFRFSNYRDLLHLLSGAGAVKFSGILMLVFLQMVALLYLLLLLPRLLRSVVVLLSVFVVIVQFSYWLTLNQFITSTDLFLILNVSADNLKGAISSFFKPLILWYTLPYTIFLFALIFVPVRSTFRKSLGLSLLPVLYLLVSNYALFLYAAEGNFHLNPMTSLLRTAFHYKVETLREYHGPREALPDLNTSRQPLNSIIYIIDESIRGSNLSLNGYPRPTTPFLQSIETRGRLKNLGICVAAGTSSYLSNAYLITGHNAFPDDAFRTFKNPTLFDYAKKMGYETIFIDVDSGYLSKLLETAPEGRVRSLGRWMNNQSFRDRQIDLETTKDLGIARYLSSLLNERGGYFILVNKKGLHFHYRNTYPDDPAFTFWKPVMEPSEPITTDPAGREKLVNTYDNGIRFQVDEFFRELVSETTNQNYVVLYTSDHGQTLAEQGQIYTHLKPDKVIVDVPAFFVFGRQYDKKESLTGICPGIRVSHLNNFATLLDLMDVPMSLRVRSYDKSIFSLTAEDNRERYYMSGSLHGSGDYVVKRVPTPPDEGWGVSRPAGNGPRDD